MIEFEYRGLNLLDEISTVEIMIDVDSKMVHIYDQNYVVEPEFDFSTKQYRVSHSFYQMTKVLYGKKFVDFHDVSDVEQWINQFTWIFYGSRKFLLIFNGGTVSRISVEENTEESIGKEIKIFEKYFKRLSFQ